MMVVTIQWRARLLAAAIHFLATLLIAGITAALIFFVWFPHAFARMMGGTQLFLLVVCSDLALGPLISLAIFNRKKSRRELIVDYVIVGAIQLAALIYGVSIVAGSRPVFVAFARDRFEVVSAMELDDADLAAAKDRRYRFRSWSGPVTVAVQFPTDVQESNKLLFSALSGKDAQLMPKYYRPYQTMIEVIKKHGQPLATLVSKHEEKKSEIDAAIKDSGFAEDSLRWLPVHSRFGFWTVLINANSGYPAKYLPIDPY